jgi:regulator of protease activity HflC (stomatin/prohibitin superfamily)
MTIPTLIAGILLPLGVFWLARALFHAFTVEVEDEQVVLVTRFGKHVSTLKAPGLYWLFDRLLPWVRLIRVSTARDFRQFVNVHVNDSKGTSVMVDLWVELRIEDPVKATFAVADWDRALCNLVSHATTSILGNREFDEILRCRVELGALLRDEIGVDCARWGICVEQAYLQSLGLRPEVERQILASVSARLERAKAELEESGRLAAALLEAETGARVAALVAEAKGQYPKAIGRAYQAMSQRPVVRAAYDELYGLAQLRPQRTVAFVGFKEQLRPADAMMLPSPELEEASGRATHARNGSRRSA